MAKNKVNLIPLEVSPLIKLARWTCLTAGIIYGFVNRRKYAASEKIFRVHEEKLRAAKEKCLALERIRRNAAEMRELETIFLGAVSPEEAEPSNNNETMSDDVVTETKL